MRKFIAAGMLVLFTMLPPPARSSDANQLVHFGVYNFYIPKSWWAEGGIWLTLRDRSQPSGARTWSKPSDEPITADEISIKVTRVDKKPSTMQQAWPHPLPELIILEYAPGPHGKSPPEQEVEKLNDSSDLTEVTEDCFTKVRSLGKDDEIFVCKGYRNKIGRQLILDLDSADLMGNRMPSSVSILIEPDVSLRYRFSNKTYPQNTWAALYRSTIDLIEYLQKAED